MSIRKYFKELIINTKNKPKRLWSSINSLLSRNCSFVLPASSSNSVLASSFLKFFNAKIAKLCSNFTPLSNNPTDVSLDSLHPLPPHLPPSLSSFTPATSEEVRLAILFASNASCCLDVIPTKLLKSCLDALLIPITRLIILFLSEGIFPDDLKQAVIKPS